jgi:hypothetical protein
VRRVGAQSALGVIGVVLRVALLRCAALVVDVGCGGAGLGVGLGLRLGGLTACVGGGHDDAISALEDAQESGEGRKGRWRRTIGRGAVSAAGQIVIAIGNYPVNTHRRLSGIGSRQVRVRDVLNVDESCRSRSAPRFSSTGCPTTTS